MSNLKCNGGDVWFTPPTNKNGLSKYPVLNTTLNNFTFVTKCKVNWDLVYNISPRREVGVVVINGKHLGICVNRFTENDYFVKGTIWTKLESGNEIPNDIFIKVNEDELNSELNISFSYNKSEKKIKLYCNGRYEERIFNGEIIDYTNSWLWIGAANAFENCSDDLKYFFYGEINYVGVYQSYFSNDEILKTLLSPHTVDFNSKPICVFDFEDQTPFKVFDISQNGNHITKFDKSWMSSI